MKKDPTVTRETLIEKFFDGYKQTHDTFGLTNFIVNSNIEPIVKYLESKGIKVTGKGRKYF